ncbi:MAG: alpha/beta hydrolase [Sphaerospermopsis sp. SIO1G1]|nr:alpha/beta hydrolase [Sphaerospermopsis sp. SIO1G1]
MSDIFDVLWLSSSPALVRFDQPLLKYLSKYMRVAQWEYCVEKDEGSSIDEAVKLLNEFLTDKDEPVHLAGHGVGGVLALSFARRYPKKVRSLTLLAVAAQPANTWHTHYYVQREIFPISRQQVLANTVRSLFGKQPRHTIKKLMSALDKDLLQTPLSHSLFKLVNLPTGNVSMPMMVCGSQNDNVVDPSALQEWLKYLKTEDHLWQYPQGNHFFHYFYPQEVGEQLLSFWQRSYLESMLLNQYISPNLAK